MQEKIYMSAYILDAICVQQEFSGLKWVRTPTKIVVNTYCKMLSECSFIGVITRLSNYFVTPIYKMIFEQDPPCMSKETIEALIDIIDLYASPFDSFIRIYSTKNPMHVLSKFSLDILVMQEVAYHISIGLTTRMH